MKIRVVIVDDQPAMVEKLTKQLEDSSSIEVVGHAGNGYEALSMVEELQPDVVLMDIEMPEMNGIDATIRLHKCCPRVKILAISMHQDKWTVRTMMKAGAAGFIAKDCTKSSLHQAVSEIYNDGTFLHVGI